MKYPCMVHVPSIIANNYASNDVCLIYSECRSNKKRKTREREKKSKLILANGFSFYTLAIWYRFSFSSYSVPIHPSYTFTILYLLLRYFNYFDGNTEPIQVQLLIDIFIR